MKLKPKQLSFILLSVALKYKKQQKNQNTFRWTTLIYLTNSTERNLV